MDSKKRHVKKTEDGNEIMALPRRLSAVNGYVYSAAAGALPYETETEKEQLLALVQIYQRGVDRTALVRFGKRKEVSRAPTRQERKAELVIMQHAMKNHLRYSKGIERILASLALRKKKKCIALSLTEIAVLGKGKLDEDFFAGEMVRK